MLLLVWFMPAVWAGGLDLHWLWDDRCEECHGHSGEFAREFLNISGEELQGRHHKHDLRRFLGNHYLASEEVDAVYAMLLAQAGNPPRFGDECASCHGTAAGFARASLEFREGLLYGRDSGSPVSGFLEQHRSLSREDVQYFTALLTRVAGEVYRPQPESQK
jgi:hypothetical protein